MRSRSLGAPLLARAQGAEGSRQTMGDLDDDEDGSGGDLRGGRRAPLRSENIFAMLGRLRDVVQPALHSEEEARASLKKLAHCNRLCAHSMKNHLVPPPAAHFQVGVRLVHLSKEYAAPVRGGRLVKAVDDLSFQARPNPASQTRLPACLLPRPSPRSGDVVPSTVGRLFPPSHVPHVPLRRWPTGASQHSLATTARRRI